MSKTDGAAASRERLRPSVRSRSWAWGDVGQWGLVLLVPACARFDYERLPFASPVRSSLDAGAGGASGSSSAPRGSSGAAGGLGGGGRGLDPSAPGGLTDASTGAAPDASTAPGPPPTCTLGVPAPLVGLGLSGALWRPDLASDGSTLFLARSSGSEQEIFTAVRTGTATQFGPATALGEINGPALDGTPFLSADLLTLYLFSSRPGGPGDRDLWTASRSGPQAAFQTPVPLPIVNAPGIDQVPTLTPDERILIWESVRSGGAGRADLWMSERASRTADFSEPVNLAELNTPAQEGGPSLSADGLTLYFISDRAGGLPDIWTASRADIASPFGSASPVDEVNSPEDEHDPYISPDGRELFFSSNRSGTQELWVVQRSCP